MRPERTIVRKEGGRVEFWLGGHFMGSVAEEPGMKWMTNRWHIGSVRVDKLKAWIKEVRTRQKSK